MSQYKLQKKKCLVFLHLNTVSFLIFIYRRPPFEGKQKCNYFVPAPSPCPPVLLPACSPLEPSSSVCSILTPSNYTRSQNSHFSHFSQAHFSLLAPGPFSLASSSINWVALGVWAVIQVFSIIRQYFHLIWPLVTSRVFSI